MQNQSTQKNAEESAFRRSKILRIVTSAVLAFCLWFYVISVERTETEQEYTGVEVVLDGESVLEENGLKIISDKDLTVTIVLNGRRSVLNRLHTSDITVRVDLTRIHESGTKNLPYEIEFPGDVQSSSIEVVSRNPDAITLTVADWETKLVSVDKIDIVGKPAEGYRIGEGVAADDESIVISGPEEIVSRIHSAGVVVNVEGAKATTSVPVSFRYYDVDGNLIQDTDDVTAKPEQTKVKVPILQEKPVDLLLPITINPDVKDVKLHLNVRVDFDNAEPRYYNATYTADNGSFSNIEEIDGKKVLNLGSLVVAGAGNSIIDSLTAAKLPVLDLSDKYSGDEGFLINEAIDGYSLKLTPENLDVWKNDIRCDGFSVTVEVSIEKKVEKTIEGVLIEEPTGALGYYPYMTNVILLGYEEDVESLSKADIKVYVDADVTVSGEYPIAVEIPEVQKNNGTKILNTGVIYVTITMPEPELPADGDLTGTGPQ